MHLGVRYLGSTATREIWHDINHSLPFAILYMNMVMKGNRIRVTISFFYSAFHICRESEKKKLFVSIWY